MTGRQTIAIIEFMNAYGADNVVRSESWQCETFSHLGGGCIHRLDIHDNRHIAWYRDGKSWRPDGKPATITNNGREYYYNENGTVNRYSR